MGTGMRSGHGAELMRGHEHPSEIPVRVPSCYGGVYKSGRNDEKEAIAKNPLSRGNSCIPNKLFQLKRNLGGAAKKIVFRMVF